MSPEAAVGGPIALVKEGDIIRINIPEMKLEIAVSDEEMAARKANGSRESQSNDRLSETLRIVSNFRQQRCYFSIAGRTEIKKKYKSCHSKSHML